MNDFFKQHYWLDLEQGITPGVHEYLNAEVTFLQKKLNQIKQKQTIIDIGCGTGRVIHALNESFPDCQFFGIDKNHFCVDYCQNRFQKENNISIIEGEVSALHQFGYSFDVIILSYNFLAIQSMKELRQSMVEIVSCLNTRGTMLGTVFHQSALATQLECYRSMGFEDISYDGNNIYVNPNKNIGLTITRYTVPMIKQLAQPYGLSGFVQKQNFYILFAWTLK